MAAASDAVPSAIGGSDRVVLGAWVRYGVGMATRNQRQEAQKRARKKQEEDRKKLEHELRLKRKATEDAWVAIMDVDRVTPLRYPHERARTCVRGMGRCRRSYSRPRMRVR